jgi:hypothetical protein
MENSVKAKTTGYLAAVIDGEVFETNDVRLLGGRRIVAGGKREDSGKSTYIEIPGSARPGTYNIGGNIEAYYNHEFGRTWYASSGTITIDLIEQHFIKYKFNFIAVEPGPGGRRFSLSGAAEIKGL